MTLDELNAEWAKDAVIGDNLFEETRKIPVLHEKYMREVFDTMSRVRMENAKLKELKRAKSEYYSGSMDAFEIRDRGWEVMNKRVMKADVPTYVETDADVVKQTLRVGVFEDKAKYLDEIMRSIRDRNFQIKNMIEWAKFTNGVH